MRGHGLRVNLQRQLCPIDRTAEQAEADWQQLRSLSVGEKAEVAHAHEAARQQLQQEAARNSSAGRLMTRFRLACAESRQRKLTWPSAKATSLLFAMRDARSKSRPYCKSPP